VLRDFPSAEKVRLPFVLGDAADAVELIVSEGLLAAQQKFHAPRA
jgi:peptidyl-tRNA hydrolase, PTH1 family